MAASTKELCCCQMKEAAEKPVSEIPIREESACREADSPSLDEFSHLLVNWSNGERAALDRLITLVYDDLRRLAHHYLGREHPGHTLQTTALVDEAYLRLLDQTRTRWKNRAQFFNMAAQMMRRILVDHARSHYRAKRGSGARKISLDDVVVLSPERGADNRSG
jgi:RNA polymerase sigma factor (TIGR02999 family)